jgi:hypothetical protein
MEEFRCEISPSYSQNRGRNLFLKFRLPFLPGHTLKDGQETASKYCWLEAPTLRLFTDVTSKLDKTQQDFQQQQIFHF